MQISNVHFFLEHPVRHIAGPSLVQSATSRYLSAWSDQRLILLSRCCWSCWCVPSKAKAPMPPRKMEEASSPLKSRAPSERAGRRRPWQESRPKPRRSKLWMSRKTDKDDFHGQMRTLQSLTLKVGLKTPEELLLAVAELCKFTRDRGRYHWKNNYCWDQSSWIFYQPEVLTCNALPLE